MIIQHPNAAHQAACIAAEGARQLAVSVASTAAAVRTAEIAFYRTVRDSAAANGQQSAQFHQALRDLGTGGA
jgi:ferritin-like metal-binding protein YciE